MPGLGASVPAPANEPSPLRRATDATFATLDARRSLYRQFARAVAVVIVAVPLVALATRLWIGALVAGLVPLLVAAYLVRDAVLIGRWRTLIIALKRDGGARVDVLERAICDSGLTAFPGRTMRAMFESLPADCRAESGPRR